MSHPSPAILSRRRGVKRLPPSRLASSSRALTAKTKAKTQTADLAPEIVQVIDLVAEIMLEQRRRRLVEGNSSAEAA